MKCSRCGSEDSGSPKFCSECGAKFVPIPDAVPVPGDEADLFYCHKHKKETTRVRCGKCERPICTKCMVIGSVGARCKSCAKHRVAIRPKGVLHDAAGGFSNIAKSRVWYVVIWAVIINVVSSLFGGRRHF